MVGSKNLARKPGSKRPGATLALIVTAAVAVYACDQAASPTAPAKGKPGISSRGDPAVGVTPGVTTLCKVGPGATFQVRVGVNATPQTVTVTGGNCATVATVNPAAQDDVIVSIAENAASYHALNHIVMQHGTEAARTMTGTNAVSFEAAHGAVVTYYNDAVVNVCKVGTNATFQYQVGLGDTFHPLSLNDGQCSSIATITPAADDVIVTVRENASPAYHIDHLMLAMGAGSATKVTGTSTVSFEGVHGAGVVFHNVAETPPASTGCTYTQGYYKNKGKGLLPAGNFFLSGQSWHDVLETEPKQGNAYYILAHQYIAAVINAKSASVPSSVAAAIASSTTYFGKGTPGNWSANGAYSKDQLTGWADLLDGYNNGKVGPGHCN